ncbi:MAG TPA: pectinesterase family protein [Phycisphaerae bacterium]|nr:pectinesterase family protein [Phycisphaerae bacterium]
MLPIHRSILLTALLATAAHAASPTLFPAAGSSNICPDTPLTITFAAPPALGTGTIQIIDADTHKPVETIDAATPVATKDVGPLSDYSYYPIIITGNEAAIYPKNHALTYHKTYYVTVDEGVFKGGPGITDPNAWRFTTKDAPPAAGATKLTIAADGTGDFCTVQGAIDFIPDNNTTPTTLFLKKGIYTELVAIQNKHALTLLGEDRKQSIIQYANNDKLNHNNGPDGKHVYHRGVFLADKCHDLVLANLTINDTTPKGGSQAEAIIFNGTNTAHAIVTNVDLHSFQDTLQINGQAYISHCDIEGDVDFMWGKGPCFFENCESKALNTKGYYTQIRNTDANHGYVYFHCTFDGSPGVKNMFLSRIEPTRFPNSEVVLLDCTLTDAVNPIGWMLNGPKGTPPEELAKSAANVHFWEFNSHTPEVQPIDAGKRLRISRQLTQAQDAEAIKNYSDPVWVLGGDWNPRSASIFGLLQSAK